MRYDFATRAELDEKAAYYRDRYRSLAVEAVAAVAEHLDAFPLSEIDGFFCWGFLTYEVRYRMLRLLQGQDDYRAIARAGDAAAGRRLRTIKRRAQRHAEALDRLMPSVGLGIALGWRSFDVRPMDLVEYDADEGGPCLVVTIYSATTRGEHLVEELRHQIDKHDLPGLPASIDAHRVDATFALVRSAEALPEALRPLAFAPRQMPCIAIRIPMPVPSPESIGREFDAAVRGERGWHRLLVGTDAHNQDNAVAVRTWGVALLMNAGVPFNQAMRQVCAAGTPHLVEVTQSKFGEDRRRLAERVPEARAMLLQPAAERSGCNP